MPSKLPSVLLLLTLTAAVSGSQAAPSGPAAAAPARLAVDRTWVTSARGYVYRIAYFTAAQAADPRWEASRLEMMKQFRVCRHGERILRRDVRWYSPTPRSGQSCAAIVYTVQCSDPNLRLLDRLDADRIGQLRLEPEPPIEPGCGEKDEARRPPPTAAQLAQRMGHPTVEELTSPTAACGPAKGASAEPIRVLPQTRIQVRTLASPGFVQAAQLQDWYPGIPASLIGYAFSQARRVLPHMPQSPISDDGANILVTQEFALGRAGQPYCVRLTARQGERRWEMRVERPRLVEEMRSVGIDGFGHSNDPRRYWYPGGDAVTLAEALAAHLLRNAAPDAEFRRSWEGKQPSAR